MPNVILREESSDSSVVRFAFAMVVQADPVPMKVANLDPPTSVEVPWALCAGIGTMRSNLADRDVGCRNLNLR
jgi:hypothetical protein